MNILGQIEAGILLLGWIQPAIIGVVCLVVGVVTAYGVQTLIAKIKTRSLEGELESRLGNAKREAENIIKSAQLDKPPSTISWLGNRKMLFEFR